MLVVAVAVQDLLIQRVQVLLAVVVMAQTLLQGQQERQIQVAVVVAAGLIALFIGLVVLAALVS
jgi:hypothetical protein